MVEIHAVVIGLVTFAFVAMGCFCVIAKSEMAIVQDDAKFWREQYETLNAKVRPALRDTVNNLVPMTDAAHTRMERLNKLIEHMSEGD